MDPGEMLKRLLYRDALMLIIDKPAGLPVHAGPGGGPNLEQNLDALRFGLPHAPGLAHRLDRDTSGCLVLGRQRKGLSRLGKLFQEGLVEKTYWAITTGCPSEAEGRIELPLRKITQRSGWKMVADPAGQSAVTDYRVLGTGDGPSGEKLAWIECKPRTGRTHQIRVHLAALGAPILGDRQYGGRSEQPLHLLARAVVVPLYPKKPAIAAEAPVPAHMRAALTRCGWRD
ncbi:MAG: RNA pseudouridine synthase [Dongia sp.]|jgi:tRNA pseudouridine32 synthase/23S rRNA pseudouridine746 synthase/23S rRNA pseudouridine1911/1915/1917 synthase